MTRMSNSVLVGYVLIKVCWQYGTQHG